MEINTKLIKLESSGYRYGFSSLWIFYSFIRMTNSYQLYNKYLLDHPDVADDYLGMFYFHIAVIVLMISFLIFFAYSDYKVKNRDRYLILKDGILFIPNTLTNKVKEIKLEDIDNIGFEGFTQEKVKINMKTTEFIFAPRLYNVFDKDIKDIYNTLNELLVTNYTLHK